MGIKTVAVYSDADEMTPHVQMADEAVHIGPPAAADSYLRVENILRAIHETKADAVHPGYGFLSENPEFAKALDEAGVAFIGPGIRAIQAMGDKIESKKLAQAAGVNTVPGQLGVIADAAEAAAIAGEIGYPVMIKASAGGGGKGMRVAYNDAEAREGFQSATNEARSSFGDDRIFIEKFVEQPRHIEIQVLADSHGNVIHLGERECSIQRRHQKVIEESPSPFLDPETRAKMGAQAVALAKAVDYKSAGTVEFIVDKDRNFYFLEMNTRLQVEHPVTEQVTGIDLVEQMIRVAAGEKLSLTQDDVKLEGWSLEARVYAEDPFRNFMPSIGRLVRYAAPAETETVRVDSGVTEGGEISMYYDPMIAKLISTGPSRDAAIASMQGALDAYYIRGITHNIPFLAAILAHPRFTAGDLSTAFIDETYADGFSTDDMAARDEALLQALAGLVQDRLSVRPFNGMNGCHSHEARTYVVASRDAETSQPTVTVQHQPAGVTVCVDERSFQIETDWRPGEGLLRGSVDGAAVCVQVDRNGLWLQLSQGGGQGEYLVLPKQTAALHALMPHKEPPDLSRFLLSPMPGLLVSVNVAKGDEVKAGETLAIVEAMKMENVLRAVQDGVVKKVHAAGGDSLAVDQAIIEFE